MELKRKIQRPLSYALSLVLALSLAGTGIFAASPGEIIPGTEDMEESQVDMVSEVEDEHSILEEDLVDDLSEEEVDGGTDAAEGKASHEGRVKGSAGSNGDAGSVSGYSDGEDGAAGLMEDDVVDSIEGDAFDLIEDGAESGGAAGTEEDSSRQMSGQMAPDGYSYLLNEWTDEEAARQYNDTSRTAANSLPLEGGGWKLGNDVVLTDAWEVPAGSLNLDLNGWSIIRDGDGETVRIGEGAELLLICSGDDGEAGQASGAITHAGGRNGSGVKIVGGKFTMAGGSIAGNVLAGSGIGAGVYVQSGSFSMTGGAITGNVSESGGGGVCVSSGCSFSMSGGVIEGNEAYNGSGVYGYSCTFALSGGSVIGNMQAGGDGGVFLNGGSTLLISGNPEISGNIKVKNGNETDDNVALRESLVTVTGELFNEIPIGVTLLDNSWNRAPGFFTTGSTGALKAASYIWNFTSNNPLYTVQEDGDELKLDVPSIHVHGDGEITYAAWTDAAAAAQYGVSSKTAANSLPTEAGSWYLTKNVELEESWSVPAGVTNLCLNGYKVAMATDGDAVCIGANAGLDLYDCQDGKGMVTHVSGKKGSGVFVDYGSFTLEGGRIIGNTAEDGGGGVKLSAGAFVMNGGTICENSTTDGVGGGLKLSGGSFSMKGGRILSNAAGFGGGVYVQAGQFVLDGGSIENNVGTNGGGGVYVNEDGTFVMNGGSVTGNTAYNGSGAYIRKCSFTLAGGSITGNQSDGGDGGVFVNEGGKLILSGDPEIYGNQKERGGSLTDDNLALRESLVTIAGELKSRHPIGLSILDKSWYRPGGIFTEGSTEELRAADYADRFVGTDSGYTVQADGMELRLVPPLHVHHFVYSAEKNVITAKCEGYGTCSATDGLTLALHVPGEPVYDGSRKEASLDSEFDPSAFPADLVIQYEGRDGTVYSQGGMAPSDAGSYTASVTVQGATARADYDIKKADPMLSFEEKRVQREIGEGAFANALHGVTDGKISYTSDNTSVASVDSSTGQVTMKGAGQARITARSEAGRNYNAASASFVLSVFVQAHSDFRWGEDNWSFENIADSFLKGKEYGSQMSDGYLTKLKGSLTNCEYRKVFKQDDGWIHMEWGGSCYGMSALAHLAFNGYLPFSAYGSKTGTLYGLGLPKNDSNVRSLITYYHLLQIKDAIQQQYRKVPQRGDEENIKELLRLLKANKTVLVGYEMKGFGSHAVLAYGVEYGAYNKGGRIYQGRILVYDPSHLPQKENDEGYKEYSIYFCTDDYAWTIPGKTIPGSPKRNVSSAEGARFNYLGASVDEINNGGYLSGTTMAGEEDGYVARLDTLEIDQSNHEIHKARESGGGYGTFSQEDDDIIEAVSYVLTGDEEGGERAVAGYNLLDAESAYKVSQSKANALNLHMSYGDCRFEAESKAGRYAIFDKKGYVEVNGSSARCTLAMTFEEEYPTDWFTVEITGDGIKKASLSRREDGYLLSADNLECVRVDVNNRDEEAHAFINISSSAWDKEASSPGEMYRVLICDHDGLDVMADFDGDDVFEKSVVGKMSLAEATAKSIPEQQYYPDRPATPVPTIYDRLGRELECGKDFTIQYSNNDKAGEARATLTGIGEYTGDIVVYFQINPIIISKNTVSIPDISAKTYTGGKIEPKPTVKFGSKKLVKETDYDLSYKNNANVGTAVVTVTGKGNYTGSVSVDFKINQAPIKNASVTMKPDSFVYSGKPHTPKPTVKFSSKTLKKGTDYTLTYKNNTNVGTATVTVIGKGNYSGKVTVSFTIVPEGTMVSQITPYSGKLTVTWKKQAKQTTGYQIQCSLNKDFKDAKTVTVKGAASVKKTITGLAKKKKYYVRVRTYRTVNKTNYYSKWSAVKTSTAK